MELGRAVGSGGVEQIDSDDVDGVPVTATAPKGPSKDPLTRPNKAQWN